MTTPGESPVEPAGSSPRSGGGRRAGASTGAGVTPPFTAPPTDRNRRGLWIGLGVGALVLVLCCFGGLAGFGILVVGANKQVEAQATGVVHDYLDALQAGNYDTAYSYLCSNVKRRVTPSEFAAEQETNPGIESFRVHPPEIGNAIVVPADIMYDNGRDDPALLRDETGVPAARSYVSAAVCDQPRGQPGSNMASALILCLAGGGSRTLDRPDGLLCSHH